MQDQSIEKIKNLQKKVKSLEKEISQRVRSYLLQNKGKNHIKPLLISQEVQTEQINCNKNNLLQQSGLSIIDQSMSLESSYHKIKANQSLIQSFNGSYTPPKIVNFDSPNEKQQLSKLLQKLVAQHNSNKKQIIQVQQVVQKPENSEDMNMFYQKQRKKMRRQIKRLKDSLQFQKLVSIHAKQGLLISQEENYRFRLQIASLQKSLQNSQHFQEKPYGCSLEFKLQNQQQCYKENNPSLNQNKLLIHHPLLNCNNSSNCQKIQILQEQNENLRKEIIDLKQQLNQFKQINQILNNSLSQKKKEEIVEKSISHDFLQILKEKIYKISNCIPIPKDNFQYNMFKPQNQDQIIQVLQRVEQYCKQIDKWQSQKDQQINRIKNEFVTIIKQILSKISKDYLPQLKQKLRMMPQMKYYKQILQQF